MIILDVECYSNYFLLSLLNSDTGATKDFELYEGKELECKIADVLRTFTTLGFNSSNYDLPMIVAALRGDTNQQLKQLSDAIINSEQVWPVLRQFKISVPSAWRAPVNSFEFHSCERTPQVANLSLSLGL